MNLKQPVLITILVLFVLSASAQDTCDCLANLSTLITKTEKNYAGYPAKTAGKQLVRYRFLVDSLRKKAVAVKSPKPCFYLLKSYVRFFRDKHFILSYTNEADYDRAQVKFDPGYFERQHAAKALALVEGIWINADSSLKLAILKSTARSYKAIVLESKDPKEPAGLVYLTLTVSKNGFLAKAYNSFITTDIPAKQKGNLLQIWNHQLFGKIYPEAITEQEQQELSTWRNNNNGLRFQQLSSRTAYLKIPSFFNNDDKIQALVSSSDSIIRSCENLIVDLRGNGGGNTGWVSFLPYFMTNPVVQHDTYLRVTPDNVKSKLADLEPFVVNPIPDEYKKYFPDPVLAAYKKAYQELPVTKAAYYPVPGVSFPLDSLLPKPARIALVVDDLCGSSTEYFFSLSKQSKKTTTYGINTIGMMDYEGMSVPTPMPYWKYILTIPIVRSSWTATHPIDQTGFKPDRLLSHIDQKDWVEYIQKDLER